MVVRIFGIPFGALVLLTIMGFYIGFSPSEQYVRWSVPIALAASGCIYLILCVLGHSVNGFYSGNQVERLYLHLFFLGLLSAATWGASLVSLPAAYTAVFGSPISVGANVIALRSSSRGCQHEAILSINHAPLGIGSCVSSEEQAALAKGQRVEVVGKGSWFGVLPFTIQRVR